MRIEGALMGLALVSVSVLYGVAARDDEGKPVGGLRWEGGVLVPCPLGWRPSERRSRSADAEVAVAPQKQRSQTEEERDQRARQEQDQRAREELARQQRREEGYSLNRVGYNAFMKSEWEEAVRLYGQALEKLPNDADIRGNLLMAQVALRSQKLQNQVVEEHRQSEVKAVAQMGEGLESLCTALSALRRDAGWALIERGDLDAALELSARPDSLMDSSVVDLRHVREGVVNLDVLRPPPSQVEAVDFPKTGQESNAGGVDFPRLETESKQTEQARAVLRSPVVDALLFSATLEESLRDKKYLSEEHSHGFAMAVARDLAMRAGIKTRSEAVRTPDGLQAVEALKPEHQAFCQQLEAKAKDAYRAYVQRRFALRDEAFKQLTKDIETLEQQLRKEGALAEGEALHSKEEKDPGFKDRLRPEFRKMVLRYEVTQLANQRTAYAELLGEIGKLLTVQTPK